MSFCLDSWAVLAWLDGDEPAATIVNEALESERPVMSWINLVEVIYRTAEENHGKDEADRVLDELRHQDHGASAWRLGDASRGESKGRASHSAR